MSQVEVLPVTDTERWRRWTDAAPRSVTADALDRPEGAGHDRVEIILANGRRLVATASSEAAVLARLIQVLERA